MKTVFFECNMGAAGDMLCAAILELLPDPDAVLERLNRIGIPDVVFEAEKLERAGIRGTHLKVTVHGEEEESQDVKSSALASDPLGDHHFHDHEHGHVHDHDHNHEHVHDHDHGHVHDHDHGHVHDHDHGHVHDHDHDHHHSHDHSHDHHHGHDHSYGHGHSHSHVHRSLEDIRKIVTGLNIPDQVRRDVLEVYRLIAEAESHAHGRTVEEIHFHEVGAIDAVADITAFCLMMRELAPERIVASPVNVGFGNVRCAHGILPVPAPAAAWILRDIPIYAGRIEGELCTPTGAALLQHFVQEFGTMPRMTIRKIGIGCGKKDFEQANCVRAMLGETEDASEDAFGQSKADKDSACAGLCHGEEPAETILELSANLDDMSPEAVGFAIEEFLAAGALDAFAVPVTMKKTRPGILLTCLCRENDRATILEKFFLHTTTLGVRERVCRRYVLKRTTRTLETSEGPVRVKEATGWSVSRKKYEYEDLARIARKKGISLDQASRIADEMY